MTKPKIPIERPERREQPLVPLPGTPKKEPERRPVPTYPREPVPVGLEYTSSIGLYTSKQRRPYEW